MMAAVEQIETPERTISPPDASFHEIELLSDPQGVVAESIRALRTHIMAQHINEGRRALVMNAASPGVGCTRVAVNLAISLCQTGVSTLLIDADLRAPSVDAFVSMSDEIKGLRQCLEGEGADISPYVQSGLLPNLSIMFAGGAAPNAQELIANDRFEWLMSECLRTYDITVIDTPPANRCSDGRRIAGLGGYSLIVARQNVSLVADIKTLAAELEADHAKVVGTVFCGD